MTTQSLPTFKDVNNAARTIAGQLPQTPLLRPPDLEQTLGQPLWLKAENLQRTGSFKTRGVLNWLLTASDRELAPGLITVSAGNHALALAWAAAQRSVPVTVVMPEGSSPMKVARTRALGARVILHGSIHDAVAHCHHLRDRHQLTLVHPYNNPRVIVGQGTLGLELMAQSPTLQRVLCPIGGGGLISGLGLALKQQHPDIELIGVEPEGAATMANAWHHNDAGASLSRVDTWASSLAPAVVGDYTYALSRRYVDRIVTVTEAGIRAATARLLTEAHLYVEPGASVGLAALLENRVTVDPDTATALIITGGNMDLEQVRYCQPDEGNDQ